MESDGIGCAGNFDPDLIAGGHQLGCPALDLEKILLLTNSYTKWPDILKIDCVLIPELLRSSS